MNDNDTTMTQAIGVASPNALPGTHRHEAARAKRILRKKALAAKLSCSESTIDNRRNPSSRWHDPTFPQPVRLGAGGSRSSAIGWVEYEVDQWLERRFNATGPM